MPPTWIRRVPGFRSGRRWKQIVAATAYGAGALTLIGMVEGAQPTATHPTAQATMTPGSAAVSSPTPTLVIVTPSPVVTTPAAVTLTPAVTPVPHTPAPVPTQVPTPVPAAPPSRLGANAASDLSGPDAAAVAAGASAICADGTYSFSQHRSGTCSDHGGVHWWTGNLGPAGPGAH